METPAACWDMKEDVMEIAGEKSVMTPEGVYIIATYDENGVPNAMNAAWGVQCGGDEIAFFLGTGL
jgi:flavin reductase (DIM6/NTAB) family NADH-FMN oxidoreductase RutF